MQAQLQEESAAERTFELVTFFLVALNGCLTGVQISARSSARYYQQTLRAVWLKSSSLLLDYSPW